MGEAGDRRDSGNSLEGAPGTKTLTRTRRQQRKGPGGLWLPEQLRGHVRRPILKKHKPKRNTVNTAPGRAHTFFFNFFFF